MGFDLLPRYPARAASPFHFNSAGWRDLMNGPVGAVIGTEPADEPKRSPRHNEGFYVTAANARMMAQIAREWITDENIQEERPERVSPSDNVAGLVFEPFDKQVAEFAAWAERSGGFWIY